MNVKLLVSVAAAVCLTWPIASFADPPGQQGGADRSQHQGQGKGEGGGQKGAGGGQGGQTGHQTRSAAQAGRTQGQFGSGAGAGHVQAGRQAQGAAAAGRTQAARQLGSSGQGGRPQAGVRSAQTRAASQTRVVTQGGQTPASVAGHRVAPVRQAAGHAPANTPALSGWDRSVTGPARDQAGQQWRTAHAGWNNNAVWRRNSNWWQGNSAFRLWGGARIGFFFVPELGYVSVPVEYRVRYWRAGEMLPSWFWRYEVRDYWTYGLPQPPDGCAWVWVDDDVALIDLSDGYILDIEHNIW